MHRRPHSLEETRRALRTSEPESGAARGAGHWKLAHTLQNLALTQAHLLLSFSLFAAVRTSPALFASFGFRDTRPAIMAFMLFQFISAPLEEVPPVGPSPAHLAASGWPA